MHCQAFEALLRMDSQLPSQLCNFKTYRLIHRSQGCKWWPFLDNDLHSEFGFHGLFVAGWQHGIWFLHGILRQRRGSKKEPLDEAEQQRKIAELEPGGMSGMIQQDVEESDPHNLNCDWWSIVYYSLTWLIDMLCHIVKTQLLKFVWP